MKAAKVLLYHVTCESSSSGVGEDDDGWGSFSCSWWWRNPPGPSVKVISTLPDLSLSFPSKHPFLPHTTHQSPRNRCHGLTLRHKMLTMAAGLLGAVHTSVTRSPTWRFNCLNSWDDKGVLVNGSLCTFHMPCDPRAYFILYTVVEELFVCFTVRPFFVVLGKLVRLSMRDCTRISGPPFPFLLYFLYSHTNNANSLCPMFVTLL